MKTKLIASLGLTALLCSFTNAAPLGSAFTYQGRLNEGAATVSGNYDFRFVLYDAAVNGSQVGGILIVEELTVVGGLFTASLDFGTVFDGSARWLEIAVRPGAGNGAFTALTPRQPLTATPYALYALTPAGPQGPQGPEGLVWRGVWNAATAYVRDDAVALNGASWVVKVDNIGSAPAIGNANWDLLAQKGDSGATGPQGAQGVVGPTGPQGPEGLVWRGVWNAATAYVRDNAVSLNGASWVVRVDNIASAPAIGNANWDLLAQKGDAGATGPQGTMGPAGSQGAPGVAGPTGATGAMGAIGPQGPIGPQGAAGSADAWSRLGNAGTVAGVNFLGTTDNQPLEIKVNGLRALRLQDNGDGSDFGTASDGAPNLIGGSPGNFVATGVVGATISGGGAMNYGGLSQPNAILADYATVGGGVSNRVDGNSFAATIGGGLANGIGFQAFMSTIGGGERNNIWPGGYNATIAGGYLNEIEADGGAIGGGERNFIGSLSHSATIAGGFWNEIGDGAIFSAIGGGESNTIESETGDATIGGGVVNKIGGDSGRSTIGGGGNNNIHPASYSCTIGGGGNNTIAGSSMFFATIAGGGGNGIGQGSDYSTVGGGQQNTIAADSMGGNDFGATIAGGSYNNIGTNSVWSSIGGGHTNTIAADSSSATIAGGIANDIGVNSDFSAIGGGFDNNIATTSAYATIAGGLRNDIGADSDYSAIGGGLDNNIAADAQFATIPGGDRNNAASFAFAAGRRAKANHTGAFVWGDASDSDIASTAPNQVTMRATGGVRIVTGSNLGLTSGVSLNANDSSWNVISDRNAKKNFRPLDHRQVLEQLAQMPIQRWNYKWEADEAVPHIGPVAQAFKAAFYPGRDDKTISTLEADGVALAAIQGLNQKVEARSGELEARSRMLEAENAKLKQQNGEMDSRLSALEKLINHRSVAQGGAR